MSRLNLRKRPRVSYYEPEEPPFDEYVFCTECRDYVYEYCSIHGPLLVIPDEKVPAKTGYPDFVPRAALTIPRVFLHLANSYIKGAGIGVFSTLTLPIGVRFGPYRGFRAPSAGDSSYAWQIYDKNNKPLHVIDARDDNASNWMRYVNCSRHFSEQNLVAYQYQGQLYYRTIKVIPRFDELLVFYGSEFAATLGIELHLYTAPCDCYSCQTRFPKKAQVKRNKRQMQIEDKPREGKILKENPVQERQENSIYFQNDQTTKKNPVEEVLKSSVHFRNDSKTNDRTASSRTIADKQPKEIQPKMPLMVAKKKKSGEKKIPGKFKAPLIKSNTSVTIVTDNNITVTDVSLNETNLKAAPLERNKFNASFNVKSDLEVNIDNDNRTSSINITASQNTESKRFKCSHCSFFCNYKSSLKTHEKIHTKDKPFKCNQCSYSSAYKNHFNIHIRIHTGEKPYTCNVCSSAFRDKKTLTRHERIHAKEKPFKCNYCSYSSAYKNLLITHMRTHTGEKPYTCGVCSSAFRDKNTLTQHERIHAKEQPFKCNYCSYSSARKNHLIIHMRTHTGEKPYTCNVCSSAFRDKNTLTRHERTHAKEKPYKCNHCSYSSARKTYLIIHMRTHTGEKPYTCDICNYRSAQLCALKYHLLSVHSGIKPHSCNVCSYRSVSKSTLKSHLKTHL